MSRQSHSSAIAAYRKRGWARFPKLFAGAELAALQAEVQWLRAVPGLFSPQGRGSVMNSTPRSDRLDPVIDLSPLFAATARSAKLRGLAEELLGGPPEFFKDRLVVKHEGAIGYGPHQDGAYWQGYGVPCDRFVTLAIHLDPATEANGAIECTDGQHLGLLTEPGIVADPDPDLLAPFTPALARPGDVLAIHSLTPHRSGPNRTQASRRILFFVYALGSPGLYERYRAASGSP